MTRRTRGATRPTAPPMAPPTARRRRRRRASEGCRGGRGGPAASFATAAPPAVPHAWKGGRTRRRRGRRCCARGRILLSRFRISVLSATLFLFSARPVGHGHTPLIDLYYGFRVYGICAMLVRASKRSSICTLVWPAEMRDRVRAEQSRCAVRTGGTGSCCAGASGGRSAARGLPARACARDHDPGARSIRAWAQPPAAAVALAAS